MDDLVARRRAPFIVIGTVVAIVTAAISLLPESFVIRLRRDALLADAAGTWALRLLLLIAVGQALFGGYRVLRVERLATLEGDRIASEPHRERPASTVAWVAAGLVALTLLYWVAAFTVTGLRTDSWAFLAVLVVQALWYYRLAGDAARWLGGQVDRPDGSKPAWDRGDSDYTPPIARGLGPPPGAPTG